MFSPFSLLLLASQGAEMTPGLAIFFLAIFFAPFIWIAIMMVQEKRQEARDKASGDFWRKKIALHEEYIADAQHDLEKFERKEGRRARPAVRPEPVQPESDE